ncbi:MAG: HPF/RaiA family ribosome-associated protein [Spirochaetaceae bacterium]|jgi:putative sigma-54 modulation protein|nr:HPF/RaiA family ribosome-associated protein [Spirochaetaceae bacterium]
MNTEVKALHFTLGEDGKEYIYKKINRIHNAENMIVDLIIKISKDGSAFIAEANVNFKWGVSAHVKEHDFELTAAIDKLTDKLEAKITKEKEKNQGKH